MSSSARERGPLCACSPAREQDLGAEGRLVAVPVAQDVHPLDRAHRQGGLAGAGAGVAADAQADAGARCWSWWCFCLSRAGGAHGGAEI